MEAPAEEGFIHSLSNHLFWDVDRNKMDANNSRAFIIQRVLEYGFMTDWKTTLAYYGKDEIIECAKNCRYLETVTMHFVSNVFNVKLEEFRCYSFKQSTQNFWPG